MVQKEIWDGVKPDKIWIPRYANKRDVIFYHKLQPFREEWAAFEPQNLADAAFGAGMIAAYLKVYVAPCSKVVVVMLTIDIDII